MGLIGGDAVVATDPVHSRVAEGQFAFFPTPTTIMAEITRKAPGFRSRYTVVVRNGSGRVGVGRGSRGAAGDPGCEPPVADQRRQLRLPPDADPGRAARRSRSPRTSVLYSAAESSSTARTCRPDTVMVIVGADVQAHDPEPKDQP